MISKDTADYLMRNEQKTINRLRTDINDIYRNTELQNEFKSINLYELITRKAAIILWGNGYRLTTKNPQITKLFTTWEKNNNLLNLFFKVERELSARGCCGVVIDPNGNGDLIFNLAQPWNTNQFSLSATGDVIVAYVWSIVRFDNNPLWMISTYTEKGIDRVYKAANDDTATIGQISVKMNSKYIYPQKVELNKDIVPAFWFENLPRQNLIGMPLGTAYPDWTALKNLQAQLDNIFENMLKEVNYNRTRVFGNFTQKEMMDLIKQADPSTVWDRNRLIDLEDDLFIQANIGETGGNKKLEILQGNPQIQTYIEAINDIIDLAFLACGYSGLKDSNSVKTTTEIQYNLGNETQITNLKKIIRQKQWKNFFDKCLMLGGINEEELDDYIFEIKDNQLKFDRDQLENQMLLEDAGLVSRVEMAQNIFGLNEAEAKDYLSKIRQHTSEFGTSKQEQMDLLTQNKNEDNLQANDTFEPEQNTDIS